MPTEDVPRTSKSDPEWYVCPPSHSDPVGWMTAAREVAATLGDSGLVAWIDEQVTSYRNHGHMAVRYVRGTP